VTGKRDRAHVVFEPKRIGTKWFVEVLTYVNDELTERYTSKGTFASYALADAAGAQMARSISDELRAIPNVRDVELFETFPQPKGNA